MAIVERDFNTEDLHPIDIVESLAEERDWDFDRIADDQIAMAIEGAWGTYSVTLAFSGREETLRLICAFEMAPGSKRMAAFHKLMALANDKCWTGAFVHWPEQKLLVYRYSLNLAGGAQATPEQIQDMLRNAVMACERFYPAFQLVAYGNEAPEKALGIAMSEAYGRA